MKLIKSDGCKGCCYEKNLAKCREVDCKGFILVEEDD